MKKTLPKKRAQARKQKPTAAPKPATKAPKPATPAAPTKAKEDNWNEWWKERKAEQAAMIAADPQAAMRVAHDRLDYGTEVLCELIEKRSLFHVWKSTDGTEDHSWDDAAQCFRSRFSYIVEQAAKYAREGNRDLIGAVWTAAKLLTEVVHDLALDKEKARELEWYGRRSLFLPSLRARDSKKAFTHDFADVAGSIHLSEDCLCHIGDDADYQLDSPVTRLVAEIVEEIGWDQESLKRARANFKRMKALHADPAYWKRLPEGDAAYARRIEAMTEDDYVVEIESVWREKLHYGGLPPLTKGTAKEWWLKAVKQEITRRFPNLKGSRLYGLLRGVKDHEKLDDLRRRGESALRSLARPAPQNPQPS